MFVREPSWLVLIGRTFASEPIFGAQKASLNMGTFTLFDEHCLWLAESRALLWMRKKKKKKRRKKMDDGVARFFTRGFGGIFKKLLTCGRCSLVSGTQNEIAVSWITLWGMIKVYWLDFSLYFRSCCLLRVCCKFGPKLASHYKLGSWVRFVELSEPCSSN